MIEVKVSKPPTERSSPARSTYAEFAPKVDQTYVVENAARIWRRDPAVRREFLNDYNSFEAFLVAQEAGLIKTLGDES